MSLLDRAGVEPAPDGGPPLSIDIALLDEVTAPAAGPVHLLAERLAVRSDDGTLGRFVGAFLAAYEPAPEARVMLHLVRVEKWWVAYQDGTRARTLTTVSEVARWLVWHLNNIALAAPSRDVLVHAAVAARDGLAVILPGRSGAGKTTLVAALALAGWSYLSDEVASLDVERPVVHPYPRPLALEPGSWDIVPEALAAWPDDVPRLVTDLRLALPGGLREGRPAGPARPVAIVFPEVAAGETARLEPMGRAEALERLVAHTFNLSGLGRAAFDGLAFHVRGCQCRRLVVDGVDTVPEVLERLVASVSNS